MKQEKPIHLLLRFSDRLLENKKTIQEHKKVIERAGSAWFGKMGKPIAQKAINELNKQIENSIPTYLYLVKGGRRKPDVFVSKLIIVSSTFPKEEKELIPQYYHELGIFRFIKFWAKIKNIQQIDSSELSKICVANSVFPIQETLIKSSSGHFYVQQKR